MSKKLKIGVVGAGGISHFAHLPGWAEVKDAEVVAIADVNRETAESVAKEFGIPKVFTDYHDLLKTELDAVDICVPNRYHTPIVLAALEAGCHVLCEKPLAVSSDEVRQMGELADRKNLKLMTAQHQRWVPATQAIKKWSDTGALGEVYHARVHATRRAFLPPRPGFIDSKLSGGGPCMDIGVHALDACLWIMNFPKPVRVSGTMKTNFAKGYEIPGKWGEWDREQFNVEDFAAGFVHFENGATLTLEASWLGHQKEDEDVSFQLYGKKAGVQWPSAHFFSVVNGVFCDGSLSTAHPDVVPHREEIRVFAETIRDNKPSPVPWTETLDVIAILEAIGLSAQQGREIVWER